MEEIKVYNTKDLVLKIDKNYNPNILKINDWESFLDKLSEGREYQKELFLKKKYVQVNTIKEIMKL